MNHRRIIVAFSVSRTRRVRSNGTRRVPTTKRRGMSLIIIVLLISITMAVSFAVVHSQAIDARVQQNATLRDSARQAALAGMSVALRTVHNSSWAGVGASISRNLSPSESFTATFTTGDESLLQSDPAYAEYPYRVTIVSTGYARDPDNADRITSHRIQAVIRLIPRKIGAEPAGWSEIQANTFCQWKKDSLSVNVPCRVEGPVRIRGTLDLCDDDIYWSSSPRWWYFSHLNTMRSNGYSDYRPFNGPMQINYSEQRSGVISRLTDALGVSVSDASSASTYTWTSATVDGSYRLYPGGKIYYAEALASDISNTELKSNPITNPLGIFTCALDTRFNGNVSLQGTVIGGCDINIHAGSNTFSSLTVPPYQHSDIPSSVRVRMPTAVVNDDFRVETDANLTFKGLVMAKDELIVLSDSQQHMNVNIQGKAAAAKLNIDPRSEWMMSSYWWADRASTYYVYYYYTWYFPVWLNRSPYYLNYQPCIQIKPDSDTTPYHWYNGNEPLFQVDSAGGDAGLRWEVIRWTDNP